MFFFVHCTKKILMKRKVRHNRESNRLHPVSVSAIQSKFKLKKTFDSEEAKNRDVCPLCDRVYVIDRDSSVRVCSNCGLQKRYASYIMEPHDHDNPNKPAPKTTRSNTTRDFIQQFTDDEKVNEEALIYLIQRFSFIHSSDKNKVTTSQIGNLLPPKFKGKVSYERLARALCGQPMPLFDPVEANDMLNVHERMLNRRIRDTGSKKQPTKHAATHNVCRVLKLNMERFFRTSRPKSDVDSWDPYYE